jgi:hypothetical protein
MICQEETEQVHEAKALGQAEEWGEEVRAPAVVGAVVLQQVLAGLVFAQTVAQRLPINWDLPAMNSNVQSAELP